MTDRWILVLGVGGDGGRLGGVGGIRRPIGLGEVSLGHLRTGPQRGKTVRPKSGLKGGWSVLGLGLG